MNNKILLNKNLSFSSYNNELILIPDLQKNESILFFSFEYRSTALLCIYSLGMLVLIPHIQLFPTSLKHSRSTRRTLYSSVVTLKTKSQSVSFYIHHAK